MSTAIPRTDLNDTSYPAEQSNPASQPGQATAKAEGDRSTSTPDNVQLSLAAQVRQLKCNGETPEMIAAEFDLPLATINRYLQSGPHEPQ